MIKKLFLAVICTLFLASCSMVYTTRGSRENYSRENPVVITPYNDPTAVGEGYLVRQLLNNGYDIVSAEYSRYHDGRHRDNGKDRRREMNEAGYILEIHCTLEPGTNNTYKTYHAKLSDKQNGRLIFVADLQRPRKAKATIRSLVKKMNSYIGVLDLIHVTVVQILAGHSPDEHIVRGAGSCVNTPFRTHYGLLVGKPYYSLLLGLTHKMTYHIAFRHIEVEIGFDAAGVRMCGHRVPHASGLQFGEAHLQLAGAFFQHVGHDELVDDAVVAVLHLACGE